MSAFSDLQNMGVLVAENPHRDEADMANENGVVWWFDRDEFQYPELWKRDPGGKSWPPGRHTEPPF